MNMSPKEYNRYVARLAKKSPLGKDLLNSFLIGGLICVIGQLILNGYTALELSEQDAAAATSVSLVFLSAVLTGLSVYDDLAKIAGAGTLSADRWLRKRGRLACNRVRSRGASVTHGKMAGQNVHHCWSCRLSTARSPVFPLRHHSRDFRAVSYLFARKAAGFPPWRETGCCVLCGLCVQLISLRDGVHRVQSRRRQDEGVDSARLEFKELGQDVSRG